MEASKVQIWRSNTNICLLVCLIIIFLGQDFNFINKNKIWPLGDCWRLTLEARQVQIWRSNTNMPSCMSIHRFVRVRISIFSSKIKSGHLEIAGR